MAGSGKRNNTRRKGPASGSASPRPTTSKGRVGALRRRAKIGVLTILDHEFLALFRMLDAPVEYVDRRRGGGGRRYVLGEMQGADGSLHAIVLALIPIMGNSPAAARAASLVEHFPRVEKVIMSGIAGGVPNPEVPEEHIRLGDLVMCNERGIVQYDNQKETPAEVEPRPLPRPPSAELVEASRELTIRQLAGERPWVAHLARVEDLPGFGRPLPETDILGHSEDPSQVIPHPSDAARVEGEPRLFRGVVGSVSPSAHFLTQQPEK